MNRKLRREHEKSQRRIQVAAKRLKHEARPMSQVEAFYHMQLEALRRKHNKERRALLAQKRLERA